MSKMSFGWSVEVAPIQNRTCPCCDDEFQTSSGIVRDDQDVELALYVANLTSSIKPRKVEFYLMCKDKKRRKRRDSIVSIELEMNRAGDVTTSVVTYEKNPLGRAMTREQVLASPLKPLIFEIVDFVVVNDPHIRPFLEEASTG